MCCWRVTGCKLVAEILAAAVKSGNTELLTMMLSEANMTTLARQDEKHRAECLGKALTAAVDYRQYAMVYALLAPPPHWGPVTALTIKA
jgi:hypothetical protein